MGLVILAGMVLLWVAWIGPEKWRTGKVYLLGLGLAVLGFLAG